MTLTRRHFARLAITAACAGTLGTGPAFAASKDRSGTLSGRRGYTVSGTVEVRTVGGVTQVVLQDNYVFDQSRNPPDIKIGFGNGERYAKGSKIHDALDVKKGAATFTVPTNIDTDQYSELYIYCEQFSVILAVAPLN